jgi:hypothetical protein
MHVELEIFKTEPVENIHPALLTIRANGKRTYDLLACEEHLIPISKA